MSSMSVVFWRAETVTQLLCWQTNLTRNYRIRPAPYSCDFNCSSTLLNTARSCFYSLLFVLLRLENTRNPKPPKKQTNKQTIDWTAQNKGRAGVNTYIYDFMIWGLFLVFLPFEDALWCSCLDRFHLRKKNKKLLLRERARQRHVPLWQLCRLQTSLMYLTGANQHLMWRRFHSDVTKRVIQQTSAVYSPCQTHAFSLRFDTESVCQLIPGFQITGSFSRCFTSVIDELCLKIM